MIARPRLDPVRHSATIGAMALAGIVVITALGAAVRSHDGTGAMQGHHDSPSLTADAAQLRES